MLYGEVSHVFLISSAKIIGTKMTGKSFHHYVHVQFQVHVWWLHNRAVRKLHFFCYCNVDVVFITIFSYIQSIWLIDSWRDVFLRFESCLFRKDAGNESKQYQKRWSNACTCMTSYHSHSQLAKMLYEM